MQKRLARAAMAAALVMTLGIVAAAQTVNVTGDWAFTVETGMGSGSPAITFKQDGESSPAPTAANSGTRTSAAP